MSHHMPSDEIEAVYTVHDSAEVERSLNAFVINDEIAVLFEERCDFEALYPEISAAVGATYAGALELMAERGAESDDPEFSEDFLREYARRIVALVDAGHRAKGGAADFARFTAQARLTGNLQQQARA